MGIARAQSTIIHEVLQGGSMLRHLIAKQVAEDALHGKLEVGWAILNPKGHHTPLAEAQAGEDGHGTSSPLSRFNLTETSVEAKVAFEALAGKAPRFFTAVSNDDYGHCDSAVVEWAEVQNPPT